MVANYDKVRGHMQLYMTSQAPHTHRTVFAMVSGLPEHQVQVISPDSSRGGRDGVGPCGAREPAARSVGAAPRAEWLPETENAHDENEQTNPTGTRGERGDKLRRRRLEPTRCAGS